MNDIAVTWSGHTLDVAHIESELDRLRFLAAGEPQGDPALVARASVLNMIVYAEQEETADHASRVIQDLAENHPSRVLILVSQPGEDESHLEADLSAHCHLNPQVEQQVCCEEIRLRVSGHAARHLHSIAIPLLVPDLPVYVWWTEDIPRDDHLLHGLTHTADRLIVDSQQVVDAPGSLSHLWRLAESEPSVGVGDLNWRRMAAVRDLLQRERRVEDVRHHLRSVESVEVKYAGVAGAEASAQALLFLSWLSDELGWERGAALGHGRGRIEYVNGEQRIAAFLVPNDYPAIDPGGLVSLKISCRSDHAQALVTISRTGDPSHVTIRTEHEGRAAESSVRVEPPQPHELLLDELDSPAHDSEYRRVLEGIPRLERAIRSW